MTDPNTPPAPDAGSTPPAYAPPPAAPAASAAPAYSAAPPAYGAPAQQPVPGRALGIAAFVVSIFFSLVGLIMGIVALVQSRKAGQKNGWAVAAIIVGSILFVISIIVGILAVVAFGAAAEFASEALRACQAVDFEGTVTVSGVEVACSSLSR
ncbi:DUF4190 domain-containing protein [Microbacterium sp.]|uniref:DUF4190 domain-containing protein n=1 Tax=Microbacterium sp. TaxID=51671 RepID=UPI003F707938